MHVHWCKHETVAQVVEAGDNNTVEVGVTSAPDLARSSRCSRGPTSPQEHNNKSSPFLGNLNAGEVVRS